VRVRGILRKNPIYFFLLLFFHHYSGKGKGSHSTGEESTGFGLDRTKARIVSGRRGERTGCRSWGLLILLHGRRKLPLIALPGKVGGHLKEKRGRASSYGKLETMILVIWETGESSSS